MPLLIAGLALFVVSHSLGIAAPDWRTRQIARIGLGPWKLAYSIVSLATLIMLAWGFGLARANPVVLWGAPAWTRHVSALLAVVGFVLIAAAYVPRTKMKAALGHPMTAGVALWALGHLLGNGRLDAVILFGTLLLWAGSVFVVRRSRDRAAGTAYAPGRLARDALAVAFGIAMALVFALFLHGPLIGVRPFG